MFRYYNALIFYESFTQLSPEKCNEKPRLSSLSVTVKIWILALLLVNILFPKTVYIRSKRLLKGVFLLFFHNWFYYRSLILPVNLFVIWQVKYFHCKSQIQTQWYHTIRIRKMRIYTNKYRGEKAFLTNNLMEYCSLSHICLSFSFCWIQKNKIH